MGNESVTAAQFLKMRGRFAKGKRLPHKPGTMNGMEREYRDRLASQHQIGNVLWYAFESITLKLADDTRYTPDFAVINADCELEFHEVKGFMEDDAWVKLKVAPTVFPFKFFRCQRATKKNGGGWTITGVGVTNTGPTP